MDCQNKLTAYTIPTHHAARKNMLKSKQFSLALKEYNVCECVSLYQPISLLYMYQHSTDIRHGWPALISLR